MTAAGDRTRRALHEAAIRVFAERGFHGVALPELARAAGIGAATVYRHYSSKEALVNAVIREKRLELAKAIWEDFDLEQPVRLGFHALWSRLCEQAQACTADIIFLELHHHDDYLEPATIKAMQASTFAPLVRLLERGQREGIVRQAKTELLITALSGLFIACFKAGLKKGQLVNRVPLSEGEALAWNAIRA